MKICTSGSFLDVCGDLVTRQDCLEALLDNRETQIIRSILLSFFRKDGKNSPVAQTKYREGYTTGSLHKSQVANQAGAYPSFCSMKRLGVFLLFPGWDASPSQGLTPSIKFPGTYLYTWVERGTVRVKCLAQEHNTMSPARAKLDCLLRSQAHKP